MGELLRSPDGLERAAAEPCKGLQFSDEELAPVIPTPGKIICVGLNYASHIEEMGHPKPSYPTLFSKFADTLTGPFDDIVVPPAAIMNDISMRDWQNRTNEWLQGKCWEATTPLGPHLVTSDKVNTNDLQVSCTINDEKLQDGQTSDLVFTPTHLVQYISTIITLWPRRHHCDRHSRRRRPRHESQALPLARRCRRYPDF